MKVNGKNKSIKCVIESCAYNAQPGDYRTLDVIKTGTREVNPTRKEYTDYGSFINKAQQFQSRGLRPDRKYRCLT